jgi:hypothetical protein
MKTRIGATPTSGLADSAGAAPAIAPPTAARIATSMPSAAADRKPVVQPVPRAGGQRYRAEHLTELTGQPGELGDHGYPTRREPLRHEPQHADEGHRVAGTDEHAQRTPEHGAGIPG